MQMMPIVDGLGEEFEGRVDAIQLDAGQASIAKLQRDSGLSGHPTFAVLDRDDKIIRRYFGPQPANLLREAMEVAADE